MFATPDQNREIRASSDLHLQNLVWIIDTGLGGEVLCKQVSGHTSKSHQLPIIGGTLRRGGSNVTVTHLGNNFHSHICAVALEQPIYPNLLYPISGLFGQASPSSHGAQRDLAIPNFAASYHANKPISEFSMEGGRVAIACALRYLHLVSELNGETVQDACLRRTRYGAVALIHGNHIEKSDLLKALCLEEIKGTNHPYHYMLTVAQEGILSACGVARFGRGPCDRHSVVEVTLKDGVLLPAIPAPSEVFVPLTDTALFGKVTAGYEVSVGKDINPSASELIPASILGASSWNDDQGRDGALAFEQMAAKVPYPVHRAVEAVRPGAQRFSFRVPNELDGLLLAMLLDRAVSPVVNALQPPVNPLGGALFGVPNVSA